MSDQQTQPTSCEAGTLGAAPAVPDVPASNEPVTAVAEVEAAILAPDQEATLPKADAPKVDAVSMEAPKVEASKAEAPKIDAPKVEAPKIDAVKPEAPRFPGNVIQAAQNQRNSRPELQDDSGVDDVLARGADVHPVRGRRVLLRHVCTKHLDERNRKVPRGGGLVRERRHVEVFGPSRGADDRGRRRREQPQ